MTQAIDIYTILVINIGFTNQYKEEKSIIIDFNRY